MIKIDEQTPAGSITNSSHILTTSGTDELQVIQISIAQTVSFLIVLAFNKISKSLQKETLRT